MTLKSLVKIIQTLSLNHKQIKSFTRNPDPDEWMNDKKAKYPAALLEDQPGSISTSGNATTLAFTMLFVDLIHAADHTDQNEIDVQSDMLSVAQDIIALLNYPGTQSYYMNPDVAMRLIIMGDTESDNDLFSGVQIDFSVRIPYTQNVCAIPAITDYGIDFNNDFN